VAATAVPSNIKNARNPPQLIPPHLLEKLVKAHARRANPSAAAADVVDISLLAGAVAAHASGIVVSHHVGPTLQED
jgi:hypothetical protein